jgi:hypothetical protein
MQLACAFCTDPRHLMESAVKTKERNIQLTEYVTALLVLAVFYKPEGRRFDSRWCGFFNLPNPSSRTMALGTPQYQESSWGVKDGRRVRLTTLPSSVSRLSNENVGASTSYNPMGLHNLLQDGFFFLPSHSINESSSELRVHMSHAFLSNVLLVWRKRWCLVSCVTR